MLFLPPSLAPPDQPPAHPAGQVLGDIQREDGSVLGRDEVIAWLNTRENFLFLPDSKFVKFNQQHREVVKSIENMLVDQGTFANMFSMLVTLKEFLPVSVFIDVIYSLIQRRK